MNPIILFDGECNFCDSSVQFIIKRDPQGLFHYASLQSEAGQELLKKYDVPADIDSMVLIEKDKAYYKSSAALRICRRLQGAWKLLYGFIIVPSFIRTSFMISLPGTVINGSERKKKAVCCRRQVFESGFYKKM